MSEKIKKDNRFIIIIILLLSLFSYYEINNNFRIGGILRDIIFLPIINDNHKELYTLINKEIKEENNELKKMLNINYSLTDFDSINASIIERNSTYWLNELIINKGHNDGVYDNQLVITSDGMIGKVIDSSYKTSKIQLITSFNTPISVTVNNTNKLLIANDYKLYIKGINEKDNIKVGDKVVTSGLSEFFPKGVLIGEISVIKKENNDIGYYSIVKLSANINNLRFVTILKRKDI